MRTIVHTLCYNLPSAVERTLASLHSLNKDFDFIHVIADCGFPLQDDELIPEDIAAAKYKNSIRLKEMAAYYGSEYVRIENIGVSQNWDQVAKHMNVGKGDVLICADPDEVVHTKDWIKALSTVMQASPKMGWLSLAMPAHLNILTTKNTKRTQVEEINVWEVLGQLNWAQGAMSGSLIAEMGSIPFMDKFHRYGHLESAVMGKMKPLGYTWSMLPDYIVTHTDDVALYREWKDQVIFRIKQHGQLSFDEFLTMRKERRI